MSWYWRSAVNARGLAESTSMPTAPNSDQSCQPALASSIQSGSTCQVALAVTVWGISMSTLSWSRPRRRRAKSSSGLSTPSSAGESSNSRSTLLV
ncbi:hypothetical protein D3C85_1371360 [compost metagenome]